MSKKSRKLIKTDPQITAISSPYRERERKYIPIVPEDIKAEGEQAIADYKRAQLQAILDHVYRCNDEFVTDEHESFAPALPANIKNTMGAPFERTGPRQRVYFVDKDLKARALNTEFRQEIGKVYGVKQTIKLGENGNGSAPTLDRREAQARLAWPGINLKALSQKDDRKFLKEHFNNGGLKPAFRMISQRERISYHPEGDKDIKIELACDLTLIGETVFGKVWQDPKLEIEIKIGPKDANASEALLDQEEARLMKLFKLERQYESNAEMGYRMLEEDLQTEAGKSTIEHMAPDEQWWSRKNHKIQGLT